MFSWCLILIGPFSCSSAFALHETVELFTGNFGLEKTVELGTQNAQLVGGPAIWILSSMVFDCKFCTCCLKLWSSELDTDGPVELFFNRTPRSQNHGSYRSKRIPGGQNYGSYCSKRPKPWELSLKTKPQRPSGRSSHGNGSPVAICRSSQKIQKYRVIFPRQNVANFNTKLITFWPIA